MSTGGAKGLDGWLALICQAVECDWQQHCYRSRGGESGGICFRGVLQVITRQRVMSGCHLRAAEIRALLRMHLHGQAAIVCSVEQTLGLRDVEGDAFAENVHRVYESLVMEGWQPVGDDRVDVFIGSPGKPRGHRVSGEGWSVDCDRISLRECAGCTEHLRLIR